MRIRVNDFRDAYYKLNHYLFFDKQGDYDYQKGGVTAHMFHTELEINAAICDLNMHEINYTMNKWKMLCNLYLDPQEVGVMCARLLHYKNKERNKGYIPDIGLQFKKRRNVSGACLLAMTVGFNPKDGWHCEVYSRASETTMRWFVDLIFVHVLLREIGSKVGFKPSQVKVYWHMASLYQSITSMPLFLILDGQEDWMKERLDDIDGAKWANTWHWFTVRRYRKSFVNQEYSSFRVQRRPMEMYQILKGEMEPKGQVWTADLTIPDFDINQELDFAQDGENDCFGAGGYR